MSVYGKSFFMSGAGGIIHAAGDPFADAMTNGPDVWEPPADVVEVANGLLIHMDLPGVERDNLDVTVDGVYLVVRGVRRDPCPGERRRYVRMEIARGVFGKIIPLPDPVAASDCTARLENGVLEIFAPFGKKPVYAVAAVRIFGS